jgi:hypothetical protein
MPSPKNAMIRNFRHVHCVFQNTKHSYHSKKKILQRNTPFKKNLTRFRDLFTSEKRDDSEFAPTVTGTKNVGVAIHGLVLSQEEEGGASRTNERGKVIKCGWV